MGYPGKDPLDASSVCKQLIVEAVRVVLRDDRDRPTILAGGIGLRGRPPVHVVHGQTGCRVEAEGTGRPHSVHQTQAEAWAQARAFAQSGKVDAFLHGLDGHIREHSPYHDDA